MKAVAQILGMCLLVAFTAPAFAEKINCWVPFCHEKRNVPAGDSKEFKLQCNNLQPTKVACYPPPDGKDLVTCKETKKADNYIQCDCSNKKNSSGKGAWFDIWCE